MSIGAGWYPDPGGSAQLRWWDGASWTDNLRAPEMPAAPAIAPPTYNPAAAEAPTWTDLHERGRDLVIPHNGLAWTSFAFGIGTILLSFTGIVAHPWGWVIIVTGPTAIVLAIVALVRRQSGRVTVSWAPIVAIVLAGIGTIIMALTLALSGLGQAVDNAAFPGVKTSSSVTPVTFPRNDELTRVNSLTYQLEEHLAVPAQNGTYPASLGFDAASGTVMLPDGTPLVALPLGWTVHYRTALGGRTYIIEVAGTTKGEYVVYESPTRTLDTYCAVSDTTCTP